MMVKATIHKPARVQATVHDYETTWLSIGTGVTIFFDSPQQAREWLFDAIRELDYAEQKFLNPPELDDDAHLEADYDDRNGD